MEMEYYDDYPSEPIGGGNPYYCCSSCGISDPQINGRLEGHSKYCEWRIRKEASIKMNKIVEDVNQKVKEYEGIDSHTEEKQKEFYDYLEKKQVEIMPLIEEMENGELEYWVKSMEECSLRFNLWVILDGRQEDE